MSHPKQISAQAAAALIGVSISRIQQLIHEDKLAVTGREKGSSRAFLISRASVIKYIENRNAPGRPTEPKKIKTFKHKFMLEKLDGKRWILIEGFDMETPAIIAWKAFMEADLVTPCRIRQVQHRRGVRVIQKRP